MESSCSSDYLEFTYAGNTYRCLPDSLMGRIITRLAGIEAKAEPFRELLAERRRALAETEAGLQATPWDADPDDLVELLSRREALTFLIERIEARVQDFGRERKAAKSNFNHERVRVGQKVAEWRRYSDPERYISYLKTPADRSNVMARIERELVDLLGELPEQLERAPA